MISPIDNKSQGRSLEMPPVLFPTRRFAVMASRDDLGQEEDSAAVQWVGMTPLDMISHLAEATEEKEASQGTNTASIAVDKIKLNSRAPPVPLLERGGESKTQRTPDSLESTYNINFESDETLSPWDPSYLLLKDIYSVQVAEHMQALARTLEAMPHYVQVKGSYKRIQDHLAGTSDWIFTHYSGELTEQAASDKIELLRNLYAETIHKMEALVDMTRALGPEEGDAKLSSKPLIKRTFTDYMMQWLKAHWTNPYPDDAGLETMASDCGVTTTVVSNWLINARTRKWRPAIVKAFELKRPVNLLLEDSINIFDGKSVREMTDYETILVPNLSSSKRRRYE